MSELDDSFLWACNETELLQMARSQGIGFLRRGLPREELISIVRGEIAPTESQFAQTAFTRAKLESFIFANWGRCASQLPGCTGHCSVYPCSDGRHVLCFLPNLVDASRA